MRSSIAGLWRDRAGKFALAKALGLLVAVYPAVWLLIRALGGDLGGRPLTEAIHVLGDWTIRFFLLTLAITPARALLDAPKLIPLRRIFGVTTAVYVVLHLLLYTADQKWNLWTVASEIVLRFYLTIGFVALLALIVLAISSTDGWQRKLKFRWKQLHRLVWPIGVLAMWHYFLQSKSNVADAAFYTGLFEWLVLWRLIPRHRHMKTASLLLLTVAAAVLTAATEAAWYGLATRIDPLRILSANLDILYQLRPAVQVLIAGLATCLVVAFRRWRKRKPVPALAIS